MSRGGSPTYPGVPPGGREVRGTDVSGSISPIIEKKSSSSSSIQQQHERTYEQTTPSAPWEEARLLGAPEGASVSELTGEALPSRSAERRPGPREGGRLSAASQAAPPGGGGGHRCQSADATRFVRGGVLALANPSVPRGGGPDTEPALLVEISRRVRCGARFRSRNMAPKGAILYIPKASNAPRRGWALPGEASGEERAGDAGAGPVAASPRPAGHSAALWGPAAPPPPALAADRSLPRRGSTATEAGGHSRQTGALWNCHLSG